VRLIAFEGEPVCISWVTVTGTDGTHTSWHAGYAQQCNVPAWYPSPDLFPSTSYRPGCVWLTNQVDFPGLQAISFKLTDLSFQSDADTNAALSQFSSNPDTLCKLTSSEIYSLFILVSGILRPVAPQAPNVPVLLRHVALLSKLVKEIY